MAEWSYASRGTRISASGEEGDAVIRLGPDATDTSDADWYRIRVRPEDAPAVAAGIATAICEAAGVPVPHFLPASEPPGDWTFISAVAGAAARVRLEGPPGCVRVECDRNLTNDQAYALAAAICDRARQAAQSADYAAVAALREVIAQAVRRDPFPGVADLAFAERVAGAVHAAGWRKEAP